MCLELELLLLGMMRGICFVCVDFFFHFSSPLTTYCLLCLTGGMLESFD